MEIYRVLARISVALMLAPLLWCLLELNGKRPDSFTLAAFPALWILLVGTLSLGAMKLEYYRTFGMRIIALGQTIGIVLLLVLTVSMSLGLVEMRLENALVPLALGQVIVFIGLRVRHWESEAVPMLKSEYEFSPSVTHAEANSRNCF